MLALPYVVVIALTAKPDKDIVQAALQAGADDAGKAWHMLGSLSGSTPGIEKMVGTRTQPSFWVPCPFPPVYGVEVPPSPPLAPLSLEKMTSVFSRWPLSSSASRIARRSSQWGVSPSPPTR